MRKGKESQLVVSFGPAVSFRQVAGAVFILLTIIAIWTAFQLLSHPDTVAGRTTPPSPATSPSAGIGTPTPGQHLGSASGVPPAPLAQGRLLLLRGDTAPYTLWTVKPNGSQLQRLPNLQLDFADDVIPSPDGRSLLLIRSLHQGQITQRGLELYTLVSGQTTSLVDAPTRGYGVQEASRSPDGSMVAFTSDAQNGQGLFDLWQVDVKARQSQALTHFAPHATPTPIKPFSWLQVPSAQAAGLVLSGAHTPQWSPHGDWIAVSYVDELQTTPVLKLVRVADGQVRTLLISGPYHRDEFTWTPEGDALIYTHAANCGGTCRIGLNDRAPVQFDQRQVIGAWTPDHSRMAFMVWSTGKKVEGDDEIWLYDYGRRESRPFVRDSDLISPDQSQWTSPGLALMPWSLDGKWFALNAQRADSTEWTWIAAADGSGFWSVAEGKVIAWLSE